MICQELSGKNIGETLKSALQRGIIEADGKCTPDPLGSWFPRLKPRGYYMFNVCRQCDKGHVSSRTPCHEKS
jgi:hypothetical protein